MPWKETDPVKERTKFILEWERRWRLQQSRVDVAELCRVFQVALQPDHGARWLVTFGALTIGQLDDAKPGRPLPAPRPRRSHYLQLSPSYLQLSPRK